MSLVFHGRITRTASNKWGVVGNTAIMLHKKLCPGYFKGKHVQPVAVTKRVRDDVCRTDQQQRGPQLCPISVAMGSHAVGGPTRIVLWKRSTSTRAQHQHRLRGEGILYIIPRPGRGGRVSARVNVAPTVEAKHGDWKPPRRPLQRDSPTVQQQGRV